MTSSSHSTGGANPTDIHVKDWEINVTADGHPLMIVEDPTGRKINLRLEQASLPEMAAALIRLADHLRRAPPCGVIRQD